MKRLHCPHECCFHGMNVRVGWDSAKRSGGTLEQSILPPSNICYVTANTQVTSTSPVYHYLSQDSSLSIVSVIETQYFLGYLISVVTF